MRHRLSFRKVTDLDGYDGPRPVYFVTDSYGTPSFWLRHNGNAWETADGDVEIVDAAWVRPHRSASLRRDDACMEHIRTTQRARTTS